MQKILLFFLWLSCSSQLLSLCYGMTSFQYSIVSLLLLIWMFPDAAPLLVEPYLSYSLTFWHITLLPPKPHCLSLSLSFLSLSLSLGLFLFIAPSTNLFMTFRLILHYYTVCKLANFAHLLHFPRAHALFHSLLHTWASFRFYFHIFGILDTYFHTVIFPWHASTSQIQRVYFTRPSCHSSSINCYLCINYRLPIITFRMDNE